MEVTVPFLVQIDKLVTLLESPVFTRKVFAVSASMSFFLIVRHNDRSTTPITRAVQISIPDQESLWSADAAATSESCLSALCRIKLDLSLTASGRVSPGNGI